MRLISWNVRGLGLKKKKDAVKLFLDTQNVDIVVLIESKLQFVSDVLIRRLWGARDIGFHFLPSSGSRGGIIIMWKRAVVVVALPRNSSFICSLMARGLDQKVGWLLSVVYGPVLDSEKNSFLMEIRRLRELLQCAWILIGDFNLMRFSHDKRGGCRITNQMRDFNDLIADLNLFEVPLRGMKYTWISSSDQSIRTRIDRAFISSEWSSLFPSTNLESLPKPTSDHLPLLLAFGNSESGPIPFRFCSWWLKEEGAMELIKQWWLSFDVSGFPGWVLWKKLCMLKIRLKLWRKQVDSDRKAKARQLLSQIQFLEALGDEDDLVMSTEDADTKEGLIAEYNLLALAEEEQLRIQSRFLWIKAGDANSKFFHQLVKGRRQRNFIHHLSINSVRFEGNIQIRQGVADYFSKFYMEDTPDRSFPEALNIPQISAASRILCDEDFSESEIWEAIKSAKNDKAPGPDGFSFDFYKLCWHFIKTDVISFLRGIQDKSQIDWRMNNTFISLLPKKESAIDVKEFRPISLINGGYKIFSKILAGRLKLVLNEVISSYQGAYLPKRNILDGVLIAAECLDARIKLGRPGIVLKLDIEKAFDSLNWKFLLQTLDHMGFGCRFLSWIGASLRTARASVIINGEPGNLFSYQRGLRQGDSSSPYLFLVAMNILSLLISRAESEGWIHGFQPGIESALSISHLQFADDTMIFLEASMEEICIVKNILRNFELLSGLKVNFSKSSMIPIGIVPDINSLAEILGCRLEALPFTYLGLPLGATFKATSIWIPFIERFENKLSSWKCSTLSKGGRLVMIKSCLSSLPIYFLSLFPMPASIYNQLEKLIRKFLWGKNANKKPFHLVRWSDCIKPVCVGGLGIRGFQLMNRALLSKWIWRFSKEANSLWRKVICSKFGSARGGIFPKIPRSSHGIGLWKNISKELSFIEENASYEIGDGFSARFWIDRWCGPLPLREVAPNLFRVVQRKQSLVNEVVKLNNGLTDINLKFYFPIEDWFMHEVVLVHNLVYSCPLDPSNRDVLVWSGNQDEAIGFSVAEAYRKLAEPLMRVFPSSSIWRKHIPLKIQFFAWSAALEKIPTHDFLTTRNIICVNYCPLCLVSDESANHLLLHCSFSRQVWAYFFKIFCICWSMPATVLELFAGWNWSGSTLRGNIIWSLLAHAIIWCLWLERNSRSHGSFRRDPPQVILSVCGLLYLWCGNRVEFKAFGSEKFLFALQEIIL